MTPVEAVILAVAGVLAILSATLLLSERTVRRRERGPVDDVMQSHAPAVLTDRTGAILAWNPAMRALSAGIADTVLPWFSSLVDRLDGPALYRLAQSAREHGFAVRPVVLADSGERRHLSVRRLSADRLVWALLPPAHLEDLLLPEARSAFDAAAFAHLRISDEGRMMTNGLFRAHFGADPAPVLAALERGGATSGDRLALRRANGATGVFRCFASTGSGGAWREYYLFPIQGDGIARSGPTRVLELVPVPLAQFELDGTLLWCNSRARAILADRAMPGAPISRLFEPMGRPLATLVTEAAEGAEGAHTRGEMVRLAGGETFLQMVLTKVRIYERETLLAVVSDASALRELEDQFAQSQKMEAVGKLAGGVAHDFNNVLTAIVGHCDLLLLRKEVSDPDYADLMQIAQNANRAAALVRQLLAFSRKQTLNPVRMSVRDVLSETHYLLDRLVGESVRLSLDFGPDLWEVRADHQQLEQVLMNLVVNARDAMEGAGTVTISARNRFARAPSAPDIPAGDWVEIEVRDTGPGIDPAVIDKVFDPFFTTKPKGEGTGLGLSTVYGIVKQSGGHISAENPPGGGAVFRILLPRVVEEGAGVPVEASLPPQPGGDLTGRGSILLVEDEAPVRAFAGRALKLRGYEVHVAETAEAAMEVLRDDGLPIDLVVSDVVMPGMDGPTLAVEARRLRPGVRIVFVSGYAEESFRKNLSETDFLFLPKPFSLNELTAAVKEALGARAA